MGEGYLRAIRQLSQTLQERLQIGSFESSLHVDAGGFLNTVQLMEVSDLTNPAKKVQKLLELLLTKDYDAFERFCDILENNSYSHWAQELRKAATGDRSGEMYATPTSNRPEENPGTIEGSQNDGLRNRRRPPPSSHGSNLNPLEEISADPPIADSESTAENEMEDVNDEDTLIIPAYVSRYKPARTSPLYKHCLSWMKRGTLLAKNYFPYFIGYIIIFSSHFMLHPYEGLWFRIYQGMGWLMRQKNVILWAVFHILPIVLALLLRNLSLSSFFQWLYSLRRLIFGISVRKKEKPLRGSPLCSLKNREETMAKVPKAICRIYRHVGDRALESTGFVIKFEQHIFLVTCLHSFFEGKAELEADAFEVLLPDYYDIAEAIKSRILDTYSFQFCSAASLKTGRDILLNGVGVPNMFVDVHKDIIVLQLREQPEGVHPIKMMEFINGSGCNDWKYAAIDIYGYHKSTLNYTHGAIISTENGQEGVFCYTASTNEGFSGAPVLVTLENPITNLPTLCPLAVHTDAGDDNEPYNVGSFLWPFLLTIKELRQCWRDHPQGPLTQREKDIINAGIVVRHIV